MKKHTKRIIESLETDEWEISNNFIKRKTDNTALWTASGWLFVDFYPNIQAFSMLEKRKVHRAICDCVARGGKP